MTHEFDHHKDNEFLTEWSSRYVNLQYILLHELKDIFGSLKVVPKEQKTKGEEAHPLFILEV